MKASDSEIFDFAKKIEDIATIHNLTLIDSILYYQETTGTETEVVTGLISPALKSKLEVEANDSNLLKNSSKLPV
jgi:hypothetical protein